jgi:cation diffusion facilitator family transporter
MAQAIRRNRRGPPRLSEHVPLGRARELVDRGGPGSLAPRARRVEEVVRSGRDACGEGLVWDSPQSESPASDPHLTRVIRCAGRVAHPAATPLSGGTQKVGSGASVRTVFVALVANIAIAAAKLIAGLLSGSSAMLAEAAHSFADSLNEVFLGISLRRARRGPDATHPLGHGRERFLWALMAAIASFLIGGCLSVLMALREFGSREPPGSALASWIVLAVSFAANGASWVQSIGQARREARERGRSVLSHLLRSSEPLVRAIVVEDTAALIGLVIAAAGLLLREVLGTNTPDAVASLLIGILLTITAFGLARPLADFLVGRSLPPEQLEELRRVLAASPVIEQILTLQAVYIGPEEVIVAAKVHPSKAATVEELAHAMDDLDHQLRAASEFVADVYLDLTMVRVDGSDET